MGSMGMASMARLLGQFVVERQGSLCCVSASLAPSGMSCAGKAPRLTMAHGL
jgi:hypothetical protein